jgi:PRC-barrel domain
MNCGRDASFPGNWLRVLDTTEGSQVDHRVPQQLHPIVPPLYTFKAEQQPLVEVENEALMVEHFNLSVDQLEDMDIHGAGGERIGEVDEILMTQEGKITAVSVEVGGFLGIGDKEVVMELAQLRREGDALMADLTKEQVKALPSWDD